MVEKSKMKKTGKKKQQDFNSTKIPKSFHIVNNQASKTTNKQQTSTQANE